MPRITKCPFGCFAIGDASLNCDHVRNPGKASAATPLSRLPADAHVLTIADPPNPISRQAEELGQAEFRYRQSQREFDDACDAVRRLDRVMPVSILGRTLVLPGLPSECNRVRF